MQKAIQQGWNIILRVEPPAPQFAQFIQKQVEKLSSEEQQKITISEDYKPTTQRIQIYKDASEVLYTDRFDWFRFEREISLLGLNIRN